MTRQSRPRSHAATGPDAPTARRPSSANGPGIALALALALLLAAAPPAAAVEAEAVRAVLEQAGPAVVRVEAVVRTEMSMGGQGSDQESSLDLVGALVTPDGLVMTWNSAFSSSRLRDMMELMGQSGMSIDMTPLSFQVYLPGSEEPAEAFLAASDPRLDLAFLQLDQPSAEPLPHVDLAAAVEPQVGQEVLAVTRLGEAFARAPYAQSGRVTGRLEQPRPAWIVEGGLQGLGLPVYDVDGRPVGVLSTIFSSVAPERTASHMQGMAGMMGLGNGMTFGPLGVFVLPAGVVSRAVEQSVERGAALREERAAERAAGATDEGGAAADEGARPEPGEGGDMNDEMDEEMDDDGGSGG